MNHSYSALLCLLLSTASAFAQTETKTFTVSDVSFQMVYVEGGTFNMGGTSEQGSNVDDDEKPVHPVTLDSYYIGQFEVTQRLWTAVMGSNPSRFKGDNLPMEKVSWYDCQTFIEKVKPTDETAFPSAH